MKRTLIALSVFCLIAAGAGAQQMMGGPGFEQELSAALQDLGAAPVGTLTVADFTKLAARISIAEQKIRYVQKARMASMMLPGMGQIITGDTLGGSLYLAADLAVVAGSLVGAYFLLPTNVQFSSLDYFNTPLTNISNTWNGNTVLEYLPAAGVLAGGMIVKMILGHFAAVGAAQDAREAIKDGSVTFTPRFGPMGPGMGMGMGFGMDMRF